MSLMERQTELQQMRLELDELLKDRNERVVLEYFNISAWVDSKLQRISMSDAVKAKLN
jgi:hypothetical protein